MENKEIVIADLIEASEYIEKSQAEGTEFKKELIAINNAISFLGDLQ